MVGGSCEAWCPPYDAFFALYGRVRVYRTDTVIEDARDDRECLCCDAISSSSSLLNVCSIAALYQRAPADRLLPRITQTSGLDPLVPQFLQPLSLRSQSPSRRVERGAARIRACDRACRKAKTGD